LVVRTYTQKPEPVSSKYLVDAFELGLSSATIRNEMAVLEELGYVYAPHTSAGRVPTEAGYRYFVRRLISDTTLATAEQTHIAHRLQTLPLATEQWMRFAASVLARTAQTAALVTQPSAQTGRFKHIELISIQGRLALMVLVLQGGTVHQRMLNLADAVPQPALSDTANRINALCQDLTANEMLMKLNQLTLLEREVLELAAELVESSSGNQARVVYREGLSDLISTLQTTETPSMFAAQAIRVFEERTFLNMILEEFLSPAAGDNVQVVIAGEGRRDEINQLSMVLSRYGVPGKLSGAIGVLGPTYINYGRAISTVRYVSSMMTNMLVELYKNGDEPEAGETTTE
ncbi:MAG TPA: heat-inducible transcriptional repressor HrcA, partial [Phototrophicaceae bacterium]|nr:heat-inducible transcriptional repressor HrcA [Phototrophicaceae bacterium]